MHPQVFTSITVNDVIAYLRAVGGLEALTAAIFAAAAGVAYVKLRANIVEGESFAWRAFSTAAARILLGAVFLVFGGINGFVQIVPEHPSSLREPCEACRAFLSGIASTGYLFPLIKATELIGGLLLILGLFVPLVLLVLAPIILNIGLYHLLLNPAGLGIATVLLVLALYLAYRHRHVFRPLLQPRVPPAVAPAAGR